MSKIIAIVNSKGGVGKTTTSIYLATLLSRLGRVLLKDADPQGSTTEWLESVEKIPFDFEIANQKNIDKNKGYDYVVIDTPPQNSDVIRSAINCADISIFPTTTSELDMSRVASTLEYIKSTATYRILLTMADPRTNSYKYAKAILEEANLSYFNAFIPRKEAIKNVVGKIPNTKDELKDYEVLFNELKELLV